MEKREGDTLPSVLSAPDFSSTERWVLNISTKEFRTISDPSLSGAACVYNKRGWLLMRPQYPCNRRVTGPLFLFNPITGAKIELPMAKALNGPGTFTFSVVDGVPDWVIHANGISLRTIRLGDTEWGSHTFKGCGGHYKDFDVSLVENQVMCVGSLGEVLSYDLLEGRWANIMRPVQTSVRGAKYAIECDDEVLRVRCPFPRFSSFDFSKLDLRRMEWVTLEESELENTSWFLGSRCSFRRQGEGKKVYTLHNEYNGPRPPPVTERPKTRKFRAKLMTPSEAAWGYDAERNVYVHDLETNVSRATLPAAFTTKSALWIDADL